MLPAAQQQLNQQHQRLNHFHQLIQSMHPKRLLAQGYLLARNEAGQVVTSAQEAAKLSHFSLTFSDGSLTVNPEPQSLTLLHEAD
jgi:exonuclease VII large subunit